MITETELNALRNPVDPFSQGEYNKAIAAFTEGSREVMERFEKTIDSALRSQIDKNKNDGDNKKGVMINFALTSIYHIAALSKIIEMYTKVGFKIYPILNPIEDRQVESFFNMMDAYFPKYHRSNDITIETLKRKYDYFVRFVCKQENFHEEAKEILYGKDITSHRHFPVNQILEITLE